MAYRTSTFDHRIVHSFPTRRSSDLKGETESGPEGRGRHVSGTVASDEETRRSGAAEDRDVRPGPAGADGLRDRRSEEHTSELQSPCNIVCRHMLVTKNNYDVLLTIC